MGPIPGQQDNIQAVARCTSNLSEVAKMSFNKILKILPPLHISYAAATVFLLPSLLFGLCRAIAVRCFHCQI